MCITFFISTYSYYLSYNIIPWLYTLLEKNETQIIPKKDKYKKTKHNV